MNAFVTFTATFKNGRTVEASSRTKNFTHAAQLVRADGTSFGAAFSTSAEGAIKGAKAYRSQVGATGATIEVVEVED